MNEPKFDVSLGMISDKGFQSSAELDNPKKVLMELDEKAKEWDKKDREEIKKFIEGKIKKEQLKIACLYEFKLKYRAGMLDKTEYKDFQTMTLEKIKPITAKKETIKGQATSIITGHRYFFKCPNCESSKIVMVENE